MPWRSRCHETPRREQWTRDTLGFAWYSLGVLLKNKGDAAGTIKALRRSAEIGVDQPAEKNRISRSQALLRELGVQ